MSQLLQDQAKQLMDRFDWEGAAALLERDVAEHPTDPWSRMYLGSCHYELRRFEKALEHYRIAETLAPNECTPLGLQADVFMAMGDRVKSGELYIRASKMDPDDDTAAANLKRWLAWTKSTSEQ
jgi:Flp pilus assembly protein TadD